MTRNLAAPFSAFITTLALVPLVLRFCEHWEILDKPGALKIHGRPIPRLGGGAIFLGIMVGIIVFGIGGSFANLCFLAALGLIWLAGLVDDLRGLHPAARLAAQAVAGVFLWWGGWRPPFMGGGLAALICMCLVVILFVNAFNFLDGSDGLAAGIACIAALSYVALPETALTKLGFGVACSTAAACAAFLFFNFHPARLFLGDSGSTTLGFLAAFLSVDVAQAGGTANRSIWFPLLVAGIPLLDALRVVTRRIIVGQSPFGGDRCHFYDVLLSCGLGPRKVAILSWSAAAIGGIVGVCLVRQSVAGIWWFTALGLMVIGIAVPAGWALTSLKKDREAVSQ